MPPNLAERLGCPVRERWHRCCMAVVSSCREVLG
jgi:hypothetical protein